MKNTFILCILLAMTFSFAKAQKLRATDKSPMDMAYFPDNFAHDRKFAPDLIGNSPAMVRVIYSRPAKNGREVFGKLVPYDKVWRTGANENTEIKFYQDVTLQGKKVKAGTYSLFSIPGEKEWTIILNSDLDYWGAYSYNDAHDVVRVTAPVKKSEEMMENFSIQLTKGGPKEAIMRFGWDNTLVELPISF